MNWHLPAVLLAFLPNNGLQAHTPRPDTSPVANVVIDPTHTDMDGDNMSHNGQGRDTGNCFKKENGRKALASDLQRKRDFNVKKYSNSFSFSESSCNATVSCLFRPTVSKDVLIAVPLSWTTGNGETHGHTPSHLFPAQHAVLPQRNCLPTDNTTVYPIALLANPALTRAIRIRAPNA